MQGRPQRMGQLYQQRRPRQQGQTGARPVQQQPVQQVPRGQGQPQRVQGRAYALTSEKAVGSATAVIRTISGDNRAR